GGEVEAVGEAAVAASEEWRRRLAGWPLDDASRGGPGADAGLGSGPLGLEVLASSERPAGRQAVAVHRFAGSVPAVVVCGRRGGPLAFPSRGSPACEGVGEVSVRRVDRAG